MRGDLISFRCKRLPFNLIWSFHSYAPFILTHQGAGWTGDVSPYATGLPYPPFGENKAAVDEKHVGEMIQLTA